MNLLIMCLCSLFINTTCSGPRGTSGQGKRNDGRPKHCADDVTEVCLPSGSGEEESEARLGLANALVEDSAEMEIQNGKKRLQITFPSLKSNANPLVELNTRPTKRKRRRNKFKKRKRSKTQAGQYGTRRRHSKSKYSAPHNNAINHSALKNYNHNQDNPNNNNNDINNNINNNIDNNIDSTYPNNVQMTNSLAESPGKSSMHDLGTRYLAGHNFGQPLNNEVEDRGGGRWRKNSTSASFSLFRKRNKQKGLPKGGKGRWRQVNPQRGAKKVIVRTHNILRGRVWPRAQNMLAMSWNSEAAEQAQDWADECRLDLTVQHPSVRWTQMHGTCGQNVHVAFKKKRWGRVLRDWWRERRFFQFGSSANNATRVAKYAQMVWYNSHKVGCGLAECGTPAGKTFYKYVCNYCPSGNDPDRLSHPYEEGSPCAACPSSCRSVCKKPGCKLCTNSCAFTDLWSNCASLALKWKQWLCNTKTNDGVARFKNCRATCQCQDKIT